MSAKKPNRLKASRASIHPEQPPAKRPKISYPPSAEPYLPISFSEIEPEIIARVHHELGIDINSPHSELSELGQAALIGHLHEKNEHIRRLAYLECCRSSPTWEGRATWIREELTKRAPDILKDFYKPRPVYAPILPPQRPLWRNRPAGPFKEVAEMGRGGGKGKGGAESPISLNSESSTRKKTKEVERENDDEMRRVVLAPTQAIRPPKLKSSTPKTDGMAVVTPAVKAAPQVRPSTPKNDKKPAATPDLETTTSHVAPFRQRVGITTNRSVNATWVAKNHLLIDLTDSPPRMNTMEVVIPPYKPSPPLSTKALPAKPSPAPSAKRSSTGTSSSKAFSNMKEAIMIRVQHSATQSSAFRMKRTTVFSHLMDLALKKLGAEMHRGFRFKGKLLQPNATPRDVGMQEGDVVELHWWWHKKAGKLPVIW